MKILLLFILLYILPFALLHDSYSLQRWGKCLMENYQNQSLTFAYFSQYYTGYKSYGAEIRTENITRYKEKFALLCYCEPNLTQSFFLSPYMHTNYDPINSMKRYDLPGTFHNAIVLCMNNTDNYQSTGIYDEYELFDTLLFKRITSVPNSIIDPFGNDAHEEHHHGNETICFDRFGFPSKDFLDQRTCLLAAKFSNKTKYMYSGPLLGNAMITFDGVSTKYPNGNNFDVEDLCFSIKNSTTYLNKDDYCFYHSSVISSSLQCCSTPSSQADLYEIVTKDKNKFFCFPGYFESEDTVSYMDNMTMKEYIKNYVNYSCSVTIKTSAAAISSDYSYSISYGAEADCINERMITVESDNFCLLDLDYHGIKFTIKKCCKDGHFCNQRLIPQKVEHTEKHCEHYIPEVLFIQESLKCQSFLDIYLNKSLKILFDYNALKVKQKIYNISDVQYYMYVQIIEIDQSSKCNIQPAGALDVVRRLKTHPYRPFSHIICDTQHCDTALDHHQKPKAHHFKCEIVNKIKFEVEKNASSYSNGNKIIWGWICYVKIDYDAGMDADTIQAGEFLNTNGHSFLGCYENDYMNGTFCCSHVFDVAQRNTICTVKKMIKRYKEEKQKKINDGTSKFGNGNNGIFTDCFVRGLPRDSCLAEAGCFETRLLEYSKNSDSIEPAGCVDNTEKYIAQNVSMASLSLGCRAEENSNRCSVVQTPDGHQRILCCCNGEECKNSLKEVPQKLGKMVSSFKSVH